jgi:hypothetical protein
MSLIGTCSRVRSPKVVARDRLAMTGDVRLAREAAGTRTFSNRRLVPLADYEHHSIARSARRSVDLKRQSHVSNARRVCRIRARNDPGTSARWARQGTAGSKEVYGLDRDEPAAPAVRREAEEDWGSRDEGRALIRTVRLSRAPRIDPRSPSVRSSSTESSPNTARCAAPSHPGDGIDQSMTSAPTAIRDSTVFATTSAGHGMTFTEGGGGGGPGCICRHTAAPKQNRLTPAVPLRSTPQDASNACGRIRLWLQLEGCSWSDHLLLQIAPHGFGQRRHRSRLLPARTLDSRTPRQHVMDR